MEMQSADSVALPSLGDVPLFLPRPYNYLRRYVDDGFARVGLAPRVIAEIESASTLSAAVGAGLGATILPESTARVVAQTCDAMLFRIVSPGIEIPLSVCLSARLPLSEPAEAVKSILLEVAASLLPGSLAET